MSTTNIRPTILPWEISQEKSSLTWQLRWQIAFARWRRWEFWPAWLFYIPIIFWILILAIRYRSLTLFTAANPALEAGGFVGEQKDQALIPLQANQKDIVAATLLLKEASIEDRLKLVADFALVHNYPLILKPNIGQRGRGVFIARNLELAKKYLQCFSAAVILQKYIEGEEFGVFIAKQPNQEIPQIISIVKKSFPKVIGDGKSTLFQLILANPRAKLIMPTLEKHWGKDWQQIPPLNSEINLVEIGAHCRGSLFEDATNLASDQLSKTMAKVCQALPGYNFGRIDLRAKSSESLTAGSDIAIIEINGVSAESAHIYHPGASLFSAWRTMCNQWSLAFAIGYQEKLNRAKPLNLREILRLAIADSKRDQQWF